MLKISFNADEVENLHYERFHHPHPRVQRKMEALYLKSQGYRHGEICKLTRISEPTLLSYLRDYQTGGIEKLKELTFSKPQSALKPHQTSIEAYFREHPPQTLAEQQFSLWKLGAHKPAYKEDFTIIYKDKNA